MPKLTIDGREVNAEAGENLIQAARRIGQEIPHFCYHEKLSIAANCRMCLVEIEKNPKLQPACQMTAQEGMVVKVNSPKALEARAAVMEFLLVNHPLDCPICDKAGECRLQDYYMDHDAKNSRQSEAKVRKPRLEVLGPYVNYNAERCIMCTRCVRFMDEVPKDTQLGVFNRGDRNVIGVFAGQPLNNPYSLNVVDLCPVGALGNLDFRFHSRVWQLEKTNSVCGGCAKGCNIEIHHKNGVLYRLIPRRNDAVNSTWMCDEGRLSYHIHNDDRATEFTAKGVRLPSADAVSKARALTQGAASEKGTGWVVFVSPMLTNEDGFAWFTVINNFLPQAELFWSGNAPGESDKLLRRADKNANRAGLNAIAESMGLKLNPWNAGIAKVKNAGVNGKLLVLGTDTPDASLDDLVANAGTSLVLGSHHSPVYHHASVALPLATHFESDGSFTNEDGQVQRVRPAHPPLHHGQQAFAWITYLFHGIEEAPSWPNAESVFADMALKVAGFTGLRLLGLGLLGKKLGSGGSESVSTSVTAEVENRV